MNLNHPKPTQAQNQLLNKATLCDSNQNESSKSQFLRKSLWLLTSSKSKKLREVVKNRQKYCSLCKNSKASPKNGPRLSVSLPSYYEHQDEQRLAGMLRKSLNSKYLTSQDYFNSKITADIMYNESRHIVSIFKDYLIFDDFSEYLKRFYSRIESLERLPRVFNFYHYYSKVFPNYVAIPESKYMFKNIERKQKIIDEKHDIFSK